MLKRGIRLLVTLVLALVATSLLAAACPALDRSAEDQSVAVGGAGVVKPKPAAFSGEPDQPQAPPPTIHRNDGSLRPPDGDDEDPDVVALLRWIGLIWGLWYARAALY